MQRLELDERLLEQDRLFVGYRFDDADQLARVVELLHPGKL